MASRGGDLERPPRQHLASNGTQVGDPVMTGGSIGRRPRGGRNLAERHTHRLGEVGSTANIGPGCDRRLPHRRGRDHTGDTRIGSDHRCAERSPRLAEPTIERQLTERYDPAGPRRNRAMGSEHTKCDRKVVGRSRLGNVGRGQVDGHTAGREVEARREDGGADPLLGLSNGCIGQPDEREDLLAPANMHLDPDRDGLNADESDRCDGSEHAPKVRHRCDAPHLRPPHVDSVIRWMQVVFVPIDGNGAMVP